MLGAAGVPPIPQHTDSALLSRCMCCLCSVVISMLLVGGYCRFSCSHVAAEYGGFLLSVRCFTRTRVLCICVLISGFYGMVLANLCLVCALVLLWSMHSFVGWPDCTQAAHSCPAQNHTPRVFRPVSCSEARGRIRTWFDSVAWDRPAVQVVVPRCGLRVVCAQAWPLLRDQKRPSKGLMGVLKHML